MAYATNDGLSLMVERLTGGGDAGRPEVRQRLEAALVPMVRRAIRTGHGMPAVVRWVQCELADDSPTDA